MVGKGHIFLIRQQSSNLILGDCIFHTYIYSFSFRLIKKNLYLHVMSLFSSANYIFKFPAPVTKMSTKIRRQLLVLNLLG